MYGLYVHLPFCKKKCFYCSFAVCVDMRQVDMYLNCLCKEIDNYRGKRISTVYIGGGTPGMLAEKYIDMVILNIKNKFHVNDMAEITIELNPESLNLSKARYLKSIGVNRVSLGIQSLDKERLKYLGRRHTPEDALLAFDILRKAGFDNINVDFLFGLPEQCVADVERDLTQILFLHPEHVSIYALTIEKNSLFFSRGVSPVNNAVQADMYRCATEMLEEKEIFQYEVSNFARPGRESRHNMNYWMCGDYIGVGVSAHSHINGHRYWNMFKIGTYMKDISSKGTAIEGEERLDIYTRFLEALLFGLRMNKGVNLVELQRRFRCSLDRQRQQVLESFVDDGFLYESKGYLKTTFRGRLILDELCNRLI